MIRHSTLFLLLLVSCLSIPFAQSAASQLESTEKATHESSTKLTTAQRRQLADVVLKAFLATHDGWSSDEVILNDELNKRFIAICQKTMENVSEYQFNWTLLNLRKAGKLSAKTTKRRNDRHDEYLHAAEIAARSMHDKYEMTTDRVFCHPERRAEFDKIAQSIAPKVSPYLLRKAALRLRKTRQLKPELVVRIADWGREIITLPAQKIVKQPQLVPTHPGIYIFRDETGYLYIGESSNLRTRVTKHLDHSDRKSLAHYLWKNGNEKITLELHAFDPDSKAKSKTVRRAYESELIRSRKPRFNIAP